MSAGSTAAGGPSPTFSVEVAKGIAGWAGIACAWGGRPFINLFNKQTIPSWYWERILHVPSSENSDSWKMLKIFSSFYYWIQGNIIILDVTLRVPIHGSLFNTRRVFDFTLHNTRLITAPSSIKQLQALWVLCGPEWIALFHSEYVAFSMPVRPFESIAQLDSYVPPISVYLLV